MKNQKWIGFGSSAGLCAGIAGHVQQWLQDEPRRKCIRSLECLYGALETVDRTELLDRIVRPQAVADKTQADLLPQQL